ncbi:MAG: sulfite exporter TauE/SafE family protein [Gammaproteobacteria bacterium]|nr:sulfite exporter TauE/SafE family protein [Gammaproteobacteria bacterium]
MVEISFAAALVVGLLGAVHCVGMCGGVVSLLTLTAGGGAGRLPLPRLLPLLLAYNLGRLASYGIAGAVAGGLGGVLASLTALEPLQRLASILAGGVMVVMGLYLGGWWFGLNRIERLGGGVWRRLEPLGQRLLPVTSPLQALAMGAVWGWLPCGLVYSVLIWSLTAGSALNGAWLMVGFGIGTLPNLLLMGVMATTLRQLLQQQWVRWIAGGGVVVLGLLYIIGV